MSQLSKLMEWFIKIWETKYLKNRVCLFQEIKKILNYASKTAYSEFIILLVEVTFDDDMAQREGLFQNSTAIEDNRAISQLVLFIYEILQVLLYLGKGADQFTPFMPKVFKLSDYHHIKPETMGKVITC